MLFILEGDFMKDTLCSYYTDSEDITAYMVKMLQLKGGEKILEPSAGEGIFIDAILKTNKKVEIEAVDINHDAIKVLRKKFEGVKDIHIRETDTLLDDKLDEICSRGGEYDCVIGNPPYGAWQEPEKRALLKKKYLGHYVKETYTLFLLRCFSALKQGGKLSFIIPDTFLFLNMHEKLRKVLLTNSKINEILIFPSKFFPGASFGYSNLSIVTLEKCSKDEAINNQIRVIKGFESSAEFRTIDERIEPLKIFELIQKDILEGNGSRFVLSEDETGRILGSNVTKLGDIADIVTGFYTGDNQKFIMSANSEVKNSKNYNIIDPTLVFDCKSLKGIPDVTEGYIPYIKSSSKRKYIRGNDEWYVRWDADTISFYKRNKKSRFQNSDFYFKEGIGIPMVKSRMINAFYMKDRVFDQAIVGIFPRENEKIFYVLALMNSEIINSIIHVINPTANNSANYVKQIPYLEPDQDTMKYISEKVEYIIRNSEKIGNKELLELSGDISTIIGNVYEEYNQ